MPAPEGRPRYLILLIDDDAMMLQALQKGLAAEGFDTETCQEGGRALQAARERRPDLIVCDVNLPDMPGRDVCRALLAQAETRHIPILMLTGEARDVADRVSALDVGAEDYLFKPISPKVLAARLRAILRASGGG